MNSWADILRSYEESDLFSVLVTVGEIRGSTPRETGANMLVTATDIIGTIGGGRLEYMAIEHAKYLLNDTSRTKSEVLSLPLGPELSQCCGGHVDILLYRLENEDADWLKAIAETLTAPTPTPTPTPTILLTNWKKNTVSRSVVTNPLDMDTIDVSLMQSIGDCLENKSAQIIRHRNNIENFTLIEPLNSPLFQLTLFGAGHVGKAVIQTMSQLPCSITWIDEREDMFPNEVPQNVSKTIINDPVALVSEAPANGVYLVMTHSHQLDLELCAEILKREDSLYLGLIGSQTKRQKFLNRLKLRGFTQAQLATLTCPIGLPHLEGKHPAQIAISVAAEILGLVQEMSQRNLENEDENISLLKR